VISITDALLRRAPSPHCSTWRPNWRRPLSVTRRSTSPCPAN